MPQVLFHIAASILLAVVLAGIITRFLFQLVRVKGSSMEHTLKNGDLLFSIRPGKYRRDEVVICRYPRRVTRTLEINAAFSLTWHTLFVKRLAALPGDVVEIREGQLYVNDAPVPDPPRMASPPHDYGPRKLGRKQYFVIGDNRYLSHDSRASDVGPISRSDIVGKVTRVLLPLSNARPVK